jgi:1-deoxy-D-xylulose-5-phosphate reductoisomerase
MAGAEEIVSHSKTDIVISGISGAAGLIPTMAAVKAGKIVGIANKEPLVMAGDLAMSGAVAHGSSVAALQEHARMQAASRLH